MRWGRVDGGLLEHWKVAAAATRLDKSRTKHGHATDAGRVAAVWLAAFCYAVRTGSNGEIPLQYAQSLVVDTAPLEVFEALASARLVRRTKSGFVLHDFDDYQPTINRDAARRDRDRRRKALARAEHDRPRKHDESATRAAARAPTIAAAVSAKIPPRVRADKSRTPAGTSTCTSTPNQDRGTEVRDLDPNVRTHAPNARVFSLALKNRKQLARLAHAALDRNADLGDGDLAEILKVGAARSRIPYDAGSIATILRAVRATRARRRSA